MSNVEREIGAMQQAGRDIERRITALESNQQEQVETNAETASRIAQLEGRVKKQEEFSKSIEEIPHLLSNMKLIQRGLALVLSLGGFKLLYELAELFIKAAQQGK